MTVDYEKKSDGVRVHHKKKSDGVRVDHEKRSDGVRVNNKKTMIKLSLSYLEILKRVQVA